MKLEHSLTLCTKINSKWIKDLNVRLDTIILLEESIGKILFDINCSNIFLDPPLRVMIKFKKWDLIKLKSFCTAKESMNKIKRQPTERGKIFVSEVTNKRLISKTYKQLIKLYIQKMNNPIKKSIENLNKHFSKEDIQMVKNHEKVCNIANYWRNANQTMRYPLTLVRGDQFTK